MGYILPSVFVIIFVVDYTYSVSNNYNSTNGGFIPSNHRYYNDRLHNQNNSNSQAISSTNQIESKLERDNHIQRFGVSGYGNTGSGLYPHSGSGVSTYQPVKIDLGGVVLGTLIGLGAILIIPKLAHIFTGGYRRSVEPEIETLTDILRKVDKALEENQIDSSACIQRVICSYVEESERNMKDGEPSTIDNLIYSLTNNSMLSYILDGTTISEAIKLGRSRNGNACDKLYQQCPLNKNNVMKVVSNMLPS